jgi:hypothetical protein
VDIVGTVAGFRPGEGFGGADFVDICYRHPNTGKRHTMLLNSSCIEPVSPEALSKLAKQQPDFPLAQAIACVIILYSWLKVVSAGCVQRKK